jgi:tRNA(fMet)-specific endonuclease VapC
VRYLLDTNVLSDFVRGDADVARRFKTTRPEDIAVSTITLMEIDYGIALQPARGRKLGPLLDAIVESVHVLPFSRADARAAGAVRAALRKRGRPIGPYDVLLAGSALARGLTFVTANLGEFQRVDGLSVESWRRGEQT